MVWQVKRKVKTAWVIQYQKQPHWLLDSAINVAGKLSTAVSIPNLVSHPNNSTVNAKALWGRSLFRRMASFARLVKS